MWESENCPLRVFLLLLSIFYIFDAVGYRVRSTENILISILRKGAIFVFRNNEDTLNSIVSLRGILAWIAIFFEPLTIIAVT